MTYSIEPRDRIYVEGYGFLSFAKNMGLHVKLLLINTVKNFLIVLKIFEIIDESRGTYTGDSTKFKTAMLRSNLCDYADEYILLNGTGDGNDDAAKRTDKRDKGVIFKNCAPFTKCISRINNTEIDNAKDIDIVMPAYNLIEYSDDYLKTSGSLWPYYKDDPNDNLANSKLFKSKVKITGKTPNNGKTKDD